MAPLFNLCTYALLNKQDVAQERQSRAGHAVQGSAKIMPLQLVTTAAVQL